MAVSDSITPPEYRVVPGGKRLIYRVGSDGTFWSSKDGGETWNQLRPSKLRSGHCRVFLGRGPEGFRYFHRLVLEAFAGPPPEPGMFACHKNDDPSDNRLENLYWGTRHDNAADAMRNGRIKKGQGSSAAKLTDAEVLEIMAMRQAGKKQLDIARHFGVTLANVQAVVYGISWNQVTGLPKKEFPGIVGRREKLSPDQVLAILARCRTGEDQSAIARDHDVCLQTINGISRGFTWNRVTGLPRKRAI